MDVQGSIALKYEIINILQHDPSILKRISGTCNHSLIVQSHTDEISRLSAFSVDAKRDINQIKSEINVLNLKTATNPKIVDVKDRDHHVPTSGINDLSLETQKIRSAIIQLQTEIIAHDRQLDDKMDELTTSIVKLETTKIEAIRKDLDGLVNNIQNNYISNVSGNMLLNDVANMKNDLAVIKGEVNTIKTDVNGIKNELTKTKEELIVVKNDCSALKTLTVSRTEYDAIKNRLDELEKFIIETKTAAINKAKNKQIKPAPVQQQQQQGPAPVQQQQQQALNGNGNGHNPGQTQLSPPPPQLIQPNIPHQVQQPNGNANNQQQQGGTFPSFVARN